MSFLIFRLIVTFPVSSLKRKIFLNAPTVYCIIIIPKTSRSLLRSLTLSFVSYQTIITIMTICCSLLEHPPPFPFPLRLTTHSAVLNLLNHLLLFPLLSPSSFLAFSVMRTESSTYLSEVDGHGSYYN